MSYDSFAGELCSKGYARMNEYEAHLSSYDHSHKQRLKDMRQLTRDPMASEKARKAEAKANAGSGLISIKIGGEASGTPKKGGFKKAGFKSAFAPAEDTVMKDQSVVVGEEAPKKVGTEAKVPGHDDVEVESDTDDEGYEMYDPRHPTD
jgi:hypothetical protein